MLPLLDYQRYGRQMILDGFGLSGQLKLQEASVVVVGAGGLGCPALQLNSHLIVDAIITALSAENAISLLGPYDIILDCTDNAPTRYLLSDTAVALGKPLVSGAAQKFEGQLCVYNLGDAGPCYRCLYPKPPAQEMVGTCEETGILGAVTGVIGNLQALEAIKIITGLHDKKPTLLLYSALGLPPFRSIKLRSRKPTCPACGTAEERLGKISEIDYVQFCGGPRPDWETRGLVNGETGARASVKELEAALAGETTVHLLDVRPETEYGICQLYSSINVPLNRLVANPLEYLPINPSTKTYVVCRLGNDSQIAADALRSVSLDGSAANVKDVVGGLRAWSREVDPAFPVY
ncbi:hypothetical protein H0H81_010467 [Sphagnurus paluster]|uniref:Rhodanese domain-containing protein n=1 Tax=Sphagnurus paluster TaxID=117069 RepID=A0A9P7GVH1_9AGAR|nr:hypothetical protein H0H81_010467 [Sphagnurus paluster]